MSVTLDGEIVRLSGRCGVEDVEALLAHLAAGARRAEFDGCESVHAAILQLLMASRVTIGGDVPEFLAKWKLLDLPMDPPGASTFS